MKLTRQKGISYLVRLVVKPRRCNQRGAWLKFTDTGNFDYTDTIHAALPFVSEAQAMAYCVQNGVLGKESVMSLCVFKLEWKAKPQHVDAQEFIDASKAAKSDGFDATEDYGMGAQ